MCGKDGKAAVPSIAHSTFYWERGMETLHREGGLKWAMEGAESRCDAAARTADAHAESGPARAGRLPFTDSGKEDRMCAILATAGASAGASGPACAGAQPGRAAYASLAARRGLPQTCSARAEPVSGAGESVGTADTLAAQERRSLAEQVDRI